MGRGWGKKMSKHSLFHIYLRPFLKVWQKASHSCLGLSQNLLKFVGVLVFFPSKSKDDTHQPNQEPDHKPCVSGLSADNAMQKDPAPPQHRGSILASPKRDLGRKLITNTKGCDSWRSSESRDNAEISAGKKCKKLADLAWVQPWGFCKIQCGPSHLFFTRSGITL